jgi:hypothetical protein
MRSILILSAKSYYATLAIKFSEDIPGKIFRGHNTISIANPNLQTTLNLWHAYPDPGAGKSQRLGGVCADRRWCSQNLGNASAGNPNRSSCRRRYIYLIIGKIDRSEAPPRESGPAAEKEINGIMSPDNCAILACLKGLIIPPIFDNVKNLPKGKTLALKKTDDLVAFALIGGGVVKTWVIFSPSTPFSDHPVLSQERQTQALH